jgi:hypothetical protein
MTQRRALSPEQEEQVWALWLRRVPVLAIAAQFGVGRNTVSRTVARITRELSKRHQTDLDGARTEALAEYDAIKCEAWRRLARCAPQSTAGVGLLSNIIAARQQQDRLLGLERIQVDHRHAIVARVEAWLSTEIEADWMQGENTG